MKVKAKKTIMAVLFIHCLLPVICLGQNNNNRDLDIKPIKYQAASNIELKKGIQKLNYSESDFGVNALNGGLYLNENDVSIPGRNGELSPIRFYSSKRVWEFSPMWYTCQRLKSSGRFGLGWDMTLGKRTLDEDNNYEIEFPGGRKSTVQKVDIYNPEYKSFDSEFNRMYDTDLWTKEGIKINFANNLVSKVTDPNGNYTQYFYHLLDDVYVPDSGKSSSGRTIYYYVNHYSYVNESAWLVDSIKCKGYEGQPYCVKYCYEINHITDGPMAAGNFYDEILGSEMSEAWRYVLKWVIYPNNDTIKYDYNSYGELCEVTYPAGGSVRYGYGQYGFSMPEGGTAAPTDTSYTRTIDTVRVKDSPSSSYSSTIYKRTADTRRSNPEKCIIIDPYGNETVKFYKHSGWQYGDMYKYYKGNGILEKTARYTGSEASGTLIDSVRNELTSDDGTEWGTNVRLSYTSRCVGDKKYNTSYYLYDNYCNPGKVYKEGDVGIPSDDCETYINYLHNSYVISVQTSGPTTVKPGREATISTIFNSPTGVNKTELYLNGDDVDVQNFSPVTSGIKYYTWDTDGLEEGTYYFKSYAFDVSGNASYSGEIAIYVSRDVQAPQTQTSSEVSSACNAYSEGYRHILNLPSCQYDSFSTSGKLSEVKFYYDGFNEIDTSGYSSYPPVMWDNPHYQVRGLLTKVTGWTGGSGYDSTRLFYDQCGNLVKTINPNGDSSKIIYAPAGDPDKYQYSRPWKSIGYVKINGYADTLCKTTEYDTCSGLPTSTTDANGQTSYVAYDLMKRAIRTINPFGDTTFVHYYDGSGPSRVDSTRLRPGTYLVSKTFFDGLGRAVQTQQRDIDGKALLVNTAYDSVGNVRKVSNIVKSSANFGTSELTDYWSSQPKKVFYYDGAGRRTKTVHQDGARDSVAYEANRVKTYDARNDSTIIIKNAFGSPDTVLDGLGHAATYTYDRLGRNTGSTDAAGKNTANYYDKLGRIRGNNGPNASSSYYYDGNSVDVLLEYDAAGNVTARKNSKGVLNYGYDALARLTRADSAGTTTAKYFYDNYDSAAYNPGTSYARGRLTCLVTCGLDTSWYVYDKLGRVTKRLFAYAGMAGGRDSVRYQYNSAGVCTTIVYPDGTTLTSRPDSLGRLKSLTGYISSVRYNAASLPLNVDYMGFEDDIFDSTTYDSRYRPTRMLTYFAGPATKRLDLSYSYWSDGNDSLIVDNLDNNYSQYFDYTDSYDALGRLTKCRIGSGTLLTYQYDNVGNRAQEVIGGTTNSFSYTANTDKLSSAAISGTNYTFSHDDAGNLTAKNGGVNRSFYYDRNNMLAKAVIDSRTITNVYGVGGLLKIKKTDSQLGSRYYAYEGINPIVEYDSTGTVKKKYVYALGKCIAYIDSSGGKYYMHHDAVGSVRVVTRAATGDAVSTYRYYPFGDSLYSTGTAKNDVKFGEKQLVPGMEAYDFSARYYDPKLGRFFSIDPMPAFGSPYVYCANNPMIFVDPTGMNICPMNPHGRWYHEKVDLGGSGGGGGGKAIVTWEYDQYGNLIGRHFDGWGIDPFMEQWGWSSNIAHPSYIWATSTNTISFDKSVTNSVKQLIMKTFYLAALYGGYEGRCAIYGFEGFNVSIGTLTNGNYGETNFKTMNITLDLSQALNADHFINTIIHEGLHGFDKNNPSLRVQEWGQRNHLIFGQYHPHTEVIAEMPYRDNNGILTFPTTNILHEPAYNTADRIQNIFNRRYWFGF